MAKYRHKKTGNLYDVFVDDAVECTNGREDKRYVVYRRGITYFVREYDEFMEKFEAADD